MIQKCESHEEKLENQTSNMPIKIGFQWLET